MKKVILDFGIPGSKREVHEYIAEEMHFPEYYGHNLDALYDMLTSITEPTAIGLFKPAPALEDIDIDLMIYIDRVCEVFEDAESSNPDLAVIFGDITDNLGFTDDEEDFDLPDFDAPGDEDSYEDEERTLSEFLSGRTGKKS